MIAILVGALLLGFVAGLALLLHALSVDWQHPPEDIPRQAPAPHATRGGAS